MRIVAEDGALGLFRGAGPTIARAMSLNMGMFAANEQAKELLAESTPLTGLPLTAGASMVAGFFAAACSLPFDFVKTRIQKMKPDAAGKVPYSGFADCFAKARCLLPVSFPVLSEPRHRRQTVDLVDACHPVRSARSRGAVIEVAVLPACFGGVGGPLIAPDARVCRQ